MPAFSCHKPHRVSTRDLLEFVLRTGSAACTHIPHNEKHVHPKLWGGGGSKGRRNQVTERQIRQLGRGPESVSALTVVHESFLENQVTSMYICESVRIPGHSRLGSNENWTFHVCCTILPFPPAALCSVAKEGPYSTHFETAFLSYGSLVISGSF